MLVYRFAHGFEFQNHFSIHNHVRTMFAHLRSTIEHRQNHLAFSQNSIRIQLRRQCILINAFNVSCMKLTMHLYRAPNDPLGQLPMRILLKAITRNKATIQRFHQYSILFSLLFSFL